MTISTEQLDQEITSALVGPSSIIPITQFNKRTNKTTQLINNEKPENHLQGMNRDYSFTFTTTTFVEKIIVKTENYSEYVSAEFNWLSIRTQAKTVESKRNSENSFTVEVNELVERFSFKPAGSYFSSPKILSVEVVGLTVSEFSTALEDIGKIDSFKNKIYTQCERKLHEAEQCEQKASEIKEEINTLKTTLKTLETEKESINDSISNLKNTRTELQENITIRTVEESEQKSRFAQIEDTIDSKAKQSQSLNQTIIDHEKTLSQLKEDINLFPTEIRSFVTQGARNISRYSFLAFLPILILCYVTWYLFGSAADFATSYASVPDENVWSIFVSRLPFVTISLGIISASYKIAGLFISEIIKINTQRLNLSKVSIIAKDVSETSEQELTLDENEKYHLRTKLKMDLLRSHLKGYIEDNYSYKPNFKEKERAPKISNSVDVPEDEEYKESGS